QVQYQQEHAEYLQKQKTYQVDIDQIDLNFAQTHANIVLANMQARADAELRRGNDLLQTQRQQTVLGNTVLSAYVAAVSQAAVDFAQAQGTTAAQLQLALFNASNDQSSVMAQATGDWQQAQADAVSNQLLANIVGMYQWKGLEKDAAQTMAVAQAAADSAQGQ